MTTEIPKFEDMLDTLTKGSHTKVRVQCVHNVTEKCQGEYTGEFREVFKNYKRNDGVFMCLLCSHRVKYTGRSNPNCKYDFDSLMSVIDSERKAYLLGWIASGGSVRKGAIIIKIHNRDLEILQQLRDFVCPSIPIRERSYDMMELRICSTQMAEDVCRHLSILYGKKASHIRFPDLDYEQLKWDFLRGYFDGDGCISPGKSGYPRCSIASNSSALLKYIQDFCEVGAYIYRDHIEWNGTNAVDFLAKLYKDASICMLRKYTLFLSIANWQPIRADMGRLPIFRWSRTIPDAPGPKKNRFSDSGYDLHLVKKAKVRGNVHYYDTGIQVQPENGYYFDLVGRSSISKSGWTLANNVGIIDSNFTGSILVALVRTHPSAEEPELPCRLVQIIPRQLILMEGEEVESLDETDRGSGGFGSSDAKKKD